MQKSLKVAVLRFPGTNCEFDTQYAFEKLGHTTELVCILTEQQASINQSIREESGPNG